MANADITNGFTPVGTLYGGSWSGQVRKCYSTANNLFRGDLVKQAADPVLSESGVYQEMDRATATTELIAGVVVGWEANPTALENLYHVASSTYAVYIANIQNLILEVQSDDATMVQSDVGLNIDATFTAGTVASGRSNMEIDGNTAAATAGLQFRIIGMADKPDYDPTDSIANQKFIVTINQSAWADQTAGV